MDEGRDPAGRSVSEPPLVAPHAPFDTFELIGPVHRAEETRRRAAAADAIARRAKRMIGFVANHGQTASHYQPPPPLLTAIDVALSVGRPLLLTGDPGTGKTLAAFWLARTLDLGDVLEFHVKSESRAQDLLYSFDAASWFRQSQLSDEGPVEKGLYVKPGPLGLAFGWEKPPERPRLVLIDEIDKAPRDFPNDLLLELDQMRFLIAETDRKVICPPDKRPVVVITSNAERRLPDPFLRRCVQHRIEFGPEEVALILAANLRMAQRSAEGEASSLAAAEANLIDAAAWLWGEMGRKGLSRKPSVDELWRWLALVTLRAASDLDAVGKFATMADRIRAGQVNDPEAFGGVRLLHSEDDVARMKMG